MSDGDTGLYLYINVGLLREGGRGTGQERGRGSERDGEMEGGSEQTGEGMEGRREEGKREGPTRRDRGEERT